MTVWTTRVDQVDLRGPNPQDLARSATFPGSSSAADVRDTPYDRALSAPRSRRQATQVLTDLCTTWKHKATLEGLRFLCVGDMGMRTMHSILYADAQFDIQADLVCPPEMSLLDEFKAELAERNVTYREMESVEDCIADADVIYMEPVVQADYTKSRDEGGEDKGLTPAAYQVTRELMRAQAKRDSIILHSLPRMDELPADVDNTRHARYWFEAFNGVVMRMALLALVLGAVE